MEECRDLGKSFPLFCDGGLCNFFPCSDCQCFILMFLWCLCWRTCCCCQHFVSSSVLGCHCSSLVLLSFTSHGVGGMCGFVFVLFCFSSSPLIFMEFYKKVFKDTFHLVKSYFGEILCSWRLHVLVDGWEVKVFLPVCCVTIHFSFFQIVTHALEKLPPSCGFNMRVPL